MAGFFLLIPFFLIRFGLLSILNKESIKRAAYFPPLVYGEKAAYWIYQFSNVAIFICMFFTKIKFTSNISSYIGLGIYTLGTLLLVLSVINFSSPSSDGLNQNGLYRLSRNPMYLAYFVYFLGCVLLTQSLILLGFVIIFQISAHFIILSEERWCIEKFGRIYLEYMKKVRRYI